MLKKAKKNIAPKGKKSTQKSFRLGPKDTFNSKYKISNQEIVEMEKNYKPLFTSLLNNVENLSFDSGLLSESPGVI